MAPRDGDFSEAVRNEIAKKAMYICSNIECFRFTGYETTDGKARTIAQAAHINAAGKSGPRADSTIPNNELKSAKNGIWLCSICHKKVDDDPGRYDEKTLRDWKSKHEKVIRNIVGKDLESALLSLGMHKRYHQETRELISFLENRRVLYEGLDHEFPPKVLNSLDMIRERLVTVRSRTSPDSDLFLATNKLQAAIDLFLKNIGKETNLRELKCDSKDPQWVKFSEELLSLRKGIGIIVKVLAGDSGYSISWLD